jgi:hypothetical protein
LQLPGNEDSEYIFTIFLAFCEQKGNTKQPTAPFSRAFEEGGAFLDKLAHRSSANSKTSGI